MLPSARRSKIPVTPLRRSRRAVAARELATRLRSLGYCFSVRNFSSMWYSAVLAMVLLGALASPVKRAPGDLEARRRSAIDRSMIRFGRSPPELTAGELRDALQRLTRGNGFLRFGRDPGDLDLARSYEDSDEVKRSPSFIRFGRDPKFIRFGRSGEDKADVPDTTNYANRKGRARDHFIRLGRDSEDGDLEAMLEEKLSAPCLDC